LKLTKKQKLAILPHLQTAVRAQIDEWKAERQIEGIVDREMSHMRIGIEQLAACLNRGVQITVFDVQDYIDDCLSREN
jgi:hypothetical protein